MRRLSPCLRQELEASGVVGTAVSAEPDPVDQQHAPEAAQSRPRAGWKCRLWLCSLTSRLVVVMLLIRRDVPVHCMMAFATVKPSSRSASALHRVLTDYHRVALTVPADNLADMAPDEATAALVGALRRVLAEPDFRWFLYCIERNNILNFTFLKVFSNAKPTGIGFYKCPISAGSAWRCCRGGSGRTASRPSFRCRE